MITITEEEFNSYTQEHFKEHPEHKGIWVGNCGTILSTRKRRPFKPSDPYGAEPYPLKACDNGSGYLHCSIGTIHRLVAETWIPNHDNLTDVNHIDEDKLNNCVENLEWISHRDNCNYGTRNARVASLLRGRTESADTRAKISVSNRGNKSTTGQKWYKEPKTGVHVYYTPEQSEVC